MEKNTNLPVLISLLLITTVFAVYGQVYHYNFVNYDDDIYVTDNAQVKRGITWEGIVWSLTDVSSGNSHPLTWLSHMLDCQLFGLNPGYHHLTNVFFHTANALLLFAVFRKMTGCLWQSAFVSALFALHPLHVESVAWIAERKDVLSTFFFFLAVWQYVKYTEKYQNKKYLTSLLFFVLALAAKPMVVTLPFVLLLLDYWPLCRFPEEKFRKSRTAWNLIREKIPFFLITALWSVLTFFAQQSGGAVRTLETYPFSVRVANAIVSYTDYLAKTVFPYNLAVLYPHAGMPSLWKILISSFLLILLFFFAFRWRNQNPWFLTGWLWYAGTLVPVIGLVQVGHQAMADRYTYIPLIGIFVIIAWGFPEITEKVRCRKIILYLTAAWTILFFSINTYMQIGHWKDSISLLTHAVSITQNNYRCHYNLGNAFSEKGQTEEAIRHYYEAIRINPEYAPAYNNLGNALAKMGRLEEAVQNYRKALQINPDSADAHANMGIIFAYQGNPEQGEKHILKAIALKPDYAQAHNNLGIILLKQNRESEALAHFIKAVTLHPDSDGKIYYHIARIYARQNQTGKAVHWLRKAAERGLDARKLLSEDKYLENAVKILYGEHDTENP